MLHKWTYVLNSSSFQDGCHVASLINLKDKQRSLSPASEKGFCHQLLLFHSTVKPWMHYMYIQCQRNCLSLQNYKAVGMIQMISHCPLNSALFMNSSLHPHYIWAHKATTVSCRRSIKTEHFQVNTILHRCQSEKWSYSDRQSSNTFNMLKLVI